MIDIQQFEHIKQKHGGYASWAVDAVKWFAELWASTEFDCGPQDYEYVVQRSIEALRNAALSDPHLSFFSLEALGRTNGEGLVGRPSACSAWQGRPKAASRGNSEGLAECRVATGSCHDLPFCSSAM